MEEASGWLSGMIDDEDLIDSVTTAWEDDDDLVAKTRTQALDLLFKDAKGLITDKTAHAKFVKGWYEKTMIRSPKPGCRY